MASEASEERILTAFILRNFERCLEEFQKRNPFSSKQLSLHQETLYLRSRFEDASAAIDDDRFLRSLHATLAGWLGRGAKLRGETEFFAAVRSRKKEIAALQRFNVASTNREIIEVIWFVIGVLDITENDTKLVAGTKLLHHILPELVAPVDRTYTAPFLLRCQADHFQTFSGQRKTCELAFGTFSTIAESVDLKSYVGKHEWNTSSTKVIDNAIVGLMKWQMSLDPQS
jgi:hypothetical protein